MMKVRKSTICSSAVNLKIKLSSFTLVSLQTPFTLREKKGTKAVPRAILFQKKDLSTSRADIGTIKVHIIKYPKCTY